MTITFPRAMPTEGADDQQFDLQRVDFMTADGDGRLASTSAGPPLWRLALTLGEMAPVSYTHLTLPTNREV